MCGLLVGVAVTFLMTTGVAGAQVYPPAAECGTQVSVSSVGPGGAITVSGSNATPGATLTITARGSYPMT